MAAADLPRFGPIESSSLFPKRIEELARFLRVTSGQARQKHFDPWRCATALGVEVVEKELPGAVDGFIRSYGDKFRITLSSSKPYVRRRLTLAHEIGHIFFTDEEPSFPRERLDPRFFRTIDNREERLCFRVAKELLMPRRPFRRDAASLDAHVGSLRVLAGEYSVSLQATLIRIRELRSWPSIMTYISSPDEQSRVPSRRCGSGIVIPSGTSGRARQALLGRLTRERRVLASWLRTNLNELYQSLRHRSYIVPETFDGRALAYRSSRGQIVASLLG